MENAKAPTLYELFYTDKNLETTGVWFKLGTGALAPQFLMARAGGTNVAFDAALSELMRPYAKEFEEDTISNETQRAIMQEVYARTVVKGWKNVRDRTGAEVPFSVEKSLEFMREMPELWFRLRDLAKEYTHYLEKQVEEGGKKLGE